MRVGLLTLLFSLAALGGAAPPDITTTVEGLRTYCAACHAVGTDLRFIRSDSDSEVWSYLYSNSAPGGATWAKEIVRVLNWPSDAPPPFDQLMDPPDHDWMPKGYARIQLSQAMDGATPLRRVLVENLENGP